MSYSSDPEETAAMHTKGGNVVGATSDTSLKPLQKVFLGGNVAIEKQKEVAINSLP